MASGIGITMARNEYEYMSAWNIIRCVSSCGLSRMGTPSSSENTASWQRSVVAIKTTRYASATQRLTPNGSVPV